MEQLTTAAVTAIGIGLLFLLHSLYRRLFLDLFRGRLFLLRERWFDLALDPKSTLRFDSDLYRSVEQSLCGILRFAHRISFMFFVIQRVSERVQNIEMDVAPVERINKSVDSIDDDYTRNMAFQIWKDIPATMLVYMACTSILFGLWTVTLLGVLIVFHIPHIRGIRNRIVKQHEPVLEQIESSAYKNLVLESP